MKKHFGLTLTVALFVSAAIPCAAGELHLSMANGRVTLVAREVTVREILAEWARVGQARIINAEKVAGTPVTLELQDVPEAQALDAVLRSAAGYVMVPRVAGTPGVSRYDRIMILASSRPPTTSTATTAQPFNGRSVQTQIQQPVSSDDDDESPGERNVTPNAVFPPPNGQMPVNGQVMPGPQPQPNQPGQQQTPMTAPRPGMLPAPQPSGVPPNPYLVSPTQTTTPAAQPTVPGPQQQPRRPGGGSGGR
jgi:hypothetical protein